MAIWTWDEISRTWHNVADTWAEYDALDISGWDETSTTPTMRVYLSDRDQVAVAVEADTRLNTFSDPHEVGDLYYVRWVDRYGTLQRAEA